MDNNVVASARFKEIIAEIRDLGFTPGAKIKRPHERTGLLRRVDFNQGVDARILCKDEMYLRELATICLKPLRIAFDHLGLREPYERAIRFAHQFGLTELSNYMLYNFHDSPEDLFERMRLNVTLNEELGIRIWSFPMRFQPTDLPDRSHIGKKWTRYQLRAIQIVLQATHGVVSGEPQFFKRAFGNTAQEFETILTLPQDYIFNRDWYEFKGGKPEYEEFQGVFKKLTPEDRVELLQLLSSCDPKDFPTLSKHAANRKLKSVLPFYVLRPKDEMSKLWSTRRAVDPAEVVPDDERVEDAGLQFEPDETPISLLEVKEQRRSRAVA